jgi:hypothetical protein
MAKGITCKNDGKHDLLKIKSLRICHIAESIAQTPTRMFAFSDFTTPLSQFPNKCAIIKGGVMLKDMWIICQMILAKGQ